MARIEFAKLPGVTPQVTVNDDRIRIGVSFPTRPGADGAVAAPAECGQATFHVPVAADGMLWMQAVLAAASHPEWTSRGGQKAKWAELTFTLDVPPGWSVKYECKRLLIDGYRLVPTPTGWEEILRVRFYRMTRTRNDQNPIELTLD